MSAPIQVLIGGVDVTAQLEDGATFSNVDPGGYEAANFSFPTDPGVKRGQPVLVTAGLETAWAGRVQRVSRKLAGGRGVAVACEGHGARLKETLVSEVWIDRDPGRWETMPRARRVELNAAANDVQDHTVAPAADGVGGLQIGLIGAWARTSKCEAYYWAPDGVTVAEVLANWDAAPILAFADPNWIAEVFSTDDSTSFVASGTGDFLNAASGTLACSLATPQRGVMMRVYYTIAGGADGVNYYLVFSCLGVFGAHGLTLRGTMTTGGGFYPSDLARDVLGRVSGVSEGVIEEASHFTVPHAVAYAPTEAERLQADWALLAGGWHWGTWDAPGALGDSPAFDFRALPETATCHIARTDLDALDLEEDLSRLYDRCEVTYTDGVSQRTVTVDRELTELADTDVGSRTLPADLGEGDADAAEAYGLLLLALAERAGRASGSGSTKAPVQLPGGGSKPAFLLKSGIDRLKVGDLPNLPLFSQGRDEFQLKRVEATIAKDGISTRLELGLGADLQEVLAARLALSVAVATFGR